MLPALTPPCETQKKKKKMRDILLYFYEMNTRERG
jgi:hypothetical protein